MGDRPARNRSESGEKSSIESPASSTIESSAASLRQLWHADALHVIGAATLRGQYLNRKLSVLEPLLEPWHGQLSVEKWHGDKRTKLTSSTPPWS